MMNETVTRKTITAEEAAEALRGSIQMDYGMEEPFRKLRDHTAKALNDYNKVVEESERNTLILQSISALFTLIATIIIYKRYDWSSHKKITNILMTGANDSKHFKMVAIATNIWNAVVVTAQAIKYIRALRG